MVGSDKSAEAPDALLRLGFGFREIGTRPQTAPAIRGRGCSGSSDEAVINRIKFNNDGADAVLRRPAGRAHLPASSASMSAPKERSTASPITSN
jgi:dihydroorotate dehydrogenase